MHGVDSEYAKTDAEMAVNVDDVNLAGTHHARRREWAALSGALKLKEKPQSIDRFLGVKFITQDTSKYKRKLTMVQREYARQQVARYDEEAAHPAGRRAAPAAKISMITDEEPGLMARSCRSYVGALMYLSRATRPDITFATNWLARSVSKWTRAQDKELEHLIGYLNQTQELGLEADVDVRGQDAEMWLELWVDSDHAGEPGRRSTTGWILLLKGERGTCVTIDWASRKQTTVARSSGEAETVALHEALARVAGVNRGLCAAGIPAMDAIEKLLDKKLKLYVKVDAAVSKAAAEKGMSGQMKYISKTQGVDLYWLRDVTQRLDVCLEKTDTRSNIADILTKPLCGARTVELRQKINVNGHAGGEPS